MANPPSKQKDIIDEKDPEELIISTDLEDEERFEAISLELANKNARRILREVARGNNTSSLIAQATGLTVQDIINHLGRLEDFGLLETDGFDASSLRGRSAKRYRVSKIGVLLIPSSPEDEPRLREQLKKKSVAILRKRFLMSIATSLAWGIVFVASALEFEVQHYSHSGPPGGNTTSIIPPPIQIITHLTPEIWSIILGLAIFSSIGVFFLAKLFAKEIVR